MFIKDLAERSHCRGEKIMRKYWENTYHTARHIENTGLEKK